MNIQKENSENYGLIDYSRYIIVSAANIFKIFGGSNIRSAIAFKQGLVG